MYMYMYMYMCYIYTHVSESIQGRALWAPAILVSLRGPKLPKT